jgi:protein-L-isoaspartate(D-aspartate) O-methyltransferase
MQDVMTGMAVRTVPDMADARRCMVDGQLRPNKVTDARLLAAIGEVPRERFLPPSLASRAYADVDVALPGGRGMTSPMVTAKLLQLLSIRDGDRVLVVGAGAGYAATVAARCGGRVVALEQEPSLVVQARIAVAGLAPPEALRLVEGPLAAGHPSAAPYDAILVEGEVEEVPSAISDQLADGGRLATVLSGAARGAVSRAVLGRRIGGGFTLTEAFDAAAPALPALRRQPGFVF